MWKLPVGARRSLPRNRKPFPLFSSLAEFSTVVSNAVLILQLAFLFLESQSHITFFHSLRTKNIWVPAFTVGGCLFVGP